MKLSIIVLSAIVAVASSYPSSPDAKSEGREIAPAQIQLNDEQPIAQDKTPKPTVADKFGKMSRCGQPCDYDLDCEGGGIGHCYACFRGQCS
ncbi:hypothetical protein TWF481_007920 [Arthrobotrys musiformis]|uniref:Uncharacterized protein n=1 Tax=Arthrobotrys musiformis TaxID=47236 RepID=A0AAV9W6P3_9PEZI